MNGQGIPCGPNSSYSFIPILSKLNWSLVHDLKICMWFGYNPQIIFVTNFCKLNLDIFSGIIYSKVNGKRILYVRNSSYSFIPILSKLHWCFGHDQKICVWSGCNTQIIFDTFSQVELSHFSGIIYNKVNGQGIHCRRNSFYSLF